MASHISLAQHEDGNKWDFASKAWFTSQGFPVINTLAWSVNNIRPLPYPTLTQLRWKIPDMNTTMPTAEIQLS